MSELILSAPRKYEPYMCDVMISVGEQGGHVPAVCQALGIKSKDTFYRWLKEYPEFADAYETYKLASQCFYENELLRGMRGEIPHFNYQAAALILQNKFGDEYKRSSNGNSTEINIGSINSIEALDSKALDDKIENLQKKLGIIP